ncbi:transposase [Phormidium sp. LEGE 05292]|uniref:RNA-guided endonuclease InsQ/TnpB family protein n=1 Tax=[Phormidium] sp. LEGE 05292 TaxID=767427 RepID=UPI0018803AA9|nr:RNA-guided endonuclease TnpB family protein [Phormidium sp. LEGE 05292]MBE9226233.1 transposase [Phormidium sp. LEGE 05292]
MTTRRQTFRLYPNKTQENQLFVARRNHAYLYNACVAHRRYKWRANKKTVTYFEQQNCLPAFKKEWVEFADLHSQSLQATVKRVDLAYGGFFQGLRRLPKFKSIRNYSGWSYPAKSGWKVNSNGKHGSVTLNDLGITIKMRGKAKQWGIPTTLTIAYKPGRNQWFTSITVDIPTVECKFGSQSDLSYESIVAFDLGTQTAITLYDGEEFTELENPRFTQKSEQKIKRKSKALRRKVAPNRSKRIKGSRRWKKARKQISKLQRKVSNQRSNWQHKVTSDIASRYDIGVTEQLNTKGMTRKAKKGSKRKKQKAGLNKSILSVGFGALNKMIAYKIEQKGGLMLILPTKQIKPSQRCPECGVVHKHWAELSNRYHICDACGFEIPRDKGSVMVMYNVATKAQPGFGTSLEDCGCLSSTNLTRKRKHTGSMQQLGQMKRQKSCRKSDGISETPSVYTAG